MKTLSLNKKGLEEFVGSEEYGSLQNFPISRIRALSHMANPRAEEEDILLVAVIDNDRTIGYLGALPDNCTDSNGDTSHFAWLSCFWVDEEYRERNIAAELFMVMMQAWKNRLAITNIVPSLESVYGKMKLFAPVRRVSGTRYWFRLNMATVLPPKHKVFRMLKPLLSAFDFVGNKVCGLLVKTRQNSDSQYTTTITNTLDNTAKEFIEQNPTDSASKRGVAELDWILNYPWIKSSGDTEEAKKYYFSSLDTSFSQHIIMVSEGCRTVALMLVNRRRNCVSVPYLFTDSANPNAARIAAEALIGYCHDTKSDMLTVFNKELCGEINLFPKKAIHQKEITRPYFLGKKVAPLLVEGVWFQDGDGDCVFC